MLTSEALLTEIESVEGLSIVGRVEAIQGLLFTARFRLSIPRVGSRCTVLGADTSLPCEVVGVQGMNVFLMPYGRPRGMSVGARVIASLDMPVLFPSVHWLGRVVDGLGNPIDHKDDLRRGENPRPFSPNPLAAHLRERVIERLDTGVRAINTFLTCCRGQRMGIFSGSGVGKSVLLSMLARYTACDVCVIGLIGERGREVREFIEDVLGEEGMGRSIVVVATSDEPPLMRRQAAYTTLTLAEYFRDQGLSVLCLMDSVTRMAMAQREIGLSAGEPPVMKGYPPSVFTELSQILERAGPGENQGSITGFFTVLVDGDDHNEPIADTVRGILDGHIVLDRNLAQRGHFPSINILKSVSRMVPSCQSKEEYRLIQEARSLLASYDDMADLIRLGAYRQGSSPEVDKAIHFYPSLMKFLSQDRKEKTTLNASFENLSAIIEKRKH